MYNILLVGSAASSSPQVVGIWYELIFGVLFTLVMSFIGWFGKEHISAWIERQSWSSWGPVVAVTILSLTAAVILQETNIFTTTPLRTERNFNVFAIFLIVMIVWIEGIDRFKVSWLNRDKESERDRLAEELANKSEQVKELKENASLWISNTEFALMFGRNFVRMLDAKTKDLRDFFDGGGNRPDSALVLKELSRPRYLELLIECLWYAIRKCRMNKFDEIGESSGADDRKLRVSMFELRGDAFEFVHGYDGSRTEVLAVANTNALNIKKATEFPSCVVLQAANTGEPIVHSYVQESNGYFPYLSNDEQRRIRFAAAFRLGTAAAATEPVRVVTIDSSMGAVFSNDTNTQRLLAYSREVLSARMNHHDVLAFCAAKAAKMPLPSENGSTLPASTGEIVVTEGSKITKTEASAGDLKKG
jgi:hypothetical protein